MHAPLSAGSHSRGPGEVVLPYVRRPSSAVASLLFLEHRGLAAAAEANACDVQRPLMLSVRGQPYAGRRGSLGRVNRSRTTRADTVRAVTEAVAMVAPTISVAWGNVSAAAGVDDAIELRLCWLVDLGFGMTHWKWIE